MQKKIACLGSAPSSIRFAPFDDPSWFILGCSPALYPLARRVDAWTELHRWEPPQLGKAELQVPWFSPEYCAWLGQLKCPVFMAEPVTDVPTSVAYPIREMIAKYGPYIWTSSLAYMFAWAMEQPGVEEIGMWGVDMAATEEWKSQRPALQFLITIAISRGLKVTLPPESDLMQPMPLYGIDESSPMSVKLLARKNELQGRLNAANQSLANCQAQVHFLNGALDDLNYMIETWTSSALDGTKIAVTDRPKMNDAIGEPGLPDVLVGMETLGLKGNGDGRAHA